MRPKIISISNQKGGVGKTTTSINLGSSFAVLGKRTLLIDLDPQANATTGLGYNPDSFSSHIYHVMIGEKDAGSVIQETKLKDFCLISSHPDLVLSLIHISEPTRPY